MQPLTTGTSVAGTPSLVRAPYDSAAGRRVHSSAAACCRAASGPDLQLRGGLLRTPTYIVAYYVQ